MGKKVTLIVCASVLAFASLLECVLLYLDAVYKKDGLVAIIGQKPFEYCAYICMAVFLLSILFIICICTQKLALQITAGSVFTLFFTAELIFLNVLKMAIHYYLTFYVLSVWEEFSILIKQDLARPVQILRYFVAFLAMACLCALVIILVRKLKDKDAGKSSGAEG